MQKIAPIEIRLVSETSFFSRLEFWRERVDGKDYTDVQRARKRERRNGLRVTTGFIYVVTAEGGN